MTAKKTTGEVSTAIYPFKSSEDRKNEQKAKKEKAEKTEKKAPAGKKVAEMKKDPPKKEASQKKRAPKAVALEVTPLKNNPPAARKRPAPKAMPKLKQGTQVFSEQEVKVRIIPLGGIDEIGKNMTVIECGEDIVVVDCGSIFPKDDMPGIDLVIPDVSYLVQNKDRIRAFLITHGHEDHIGAIAYVLKQVDAPVYGTRIALALIEHKLREHRMQNTRLHVVSPGTSVKLGEMTVDFIHMNHSIAGAVALGIHTLGGTIVHTGDFKIDFTPVDGDIADLGKLAELGRQGVLALLCDSTNVERPGHTMSEQKVGETFKNFFPKAGGRIIIAMFASNIHRVQMVVDAAHMHGRRVAFAGRSMINVSKIAMQLGELKMPEDCYIELDHLDRYNDDEIVVVTTGSQGEPMSGLSRMASGEHQKLLIKQSDMVIISASPIPGNERTVSRVINLLVRRGANVIYEAMADVHVSGHACQEELKLMHALVRPKYFIPVHGEYRHLSQHALLAQSMGMPASHTLIPELGNVVEVSHGGLRIGGAVQTGGVMVDGLGIGDVGNIVLRDRKHLSQDGLMIVVISVSKENGQVVSGPDIISRGFVYVRESENLMEHARNVVRRVVAETPTADLSEWSPLKTRIRDDLHRFLYEKTKRNPMILPIIVETL